MSARFGRLSLMTALVALTVPLAALPPAMADSFHMASGKVIVGKTEDIVGEMIYYKAKTGHHSLRRLDLASDEDQIILYNGNTYRGRVYFSDAYNIEVKTAQGPMHLLKIWLKDIKYGLPGLAPASAERNVNYTPSATSSDPEPFPAIRSTP
jgi:hypothetical protein